MTDALLPDKVMVTASFWSTSEDDSTNAELSDLVSAEVASSLLPDSSVTDTSVSDASVPDDPAAAEADAEQPVADKSRDAVRMTAPRRPQYFFQLQNFIRRSSS